MEFTITNEHDLIDVIIKCLNEENLTGSLILADNMQFNIKLKGKKWDGQIDQNTVAILDSFYKSLFKALKQISKENDYIPSNIKNKIRVIATVDEGCENIIIALKDIIKYIKDVDAKQLMALSSIVLIAVVGCNINSVIDMVKEKNKQQYEEKIKELDVKEREIELNNMLEMYKASAVLPMQIAQQPYIQAKNKMDAGDTLTIVATNKEYSKQELSEEFKDSEESVYTETYYIDSEYYVTERKNIKTNSATIKEKKSEKTIKDALVLLSDVEKAILAEHLDKKTIVKLQVTIDIDESGHIVSANIIGIGEPRENTKNISDILK